jgi:hypothetical protein
MKQAPAIYTSQVIQAILDRDVQERKADSQEDFMSSACICSNHLEIQEATAANRPVPMKNWAAKFVYKWGTWTVWTEGANFTYKSKKIFFPQIAGA